MVANLVTVTFKRPILASGARGESFKEFRPMKIKGCIGERLNFNENESQGVVTYRTNQGIDPDGNVFAIGVGFERNYDEWMDEYNKDSHFPPFHDPSNVTPLIITVGLSNIDSEVE